ncbi:hypothetical protein [Lacticaseibacillus camelliae]|uniref:hypothetical protein n=1 Tax=Lacticaseibacillus camelliae TaxID=381742 RepID=UPI000A9989C5|nr:hypothetical protein [Lacticaseibacillus camelliae]
MKRFRRLIILLTVLFAAGGCAKKATKPASSSSKTVITSRQYTTQQLQARYVKVADVVIKPLNQASYKQSAETIKASVKTGQAKLNQIALQLADNQSNPALTKALQSYVKAAQTTLTTMVGTDQAAYNTASKNFFTQCQTLGQRDFGGQLPQSVIDYSKRTQAAAKASSSDSTSSSSSLQSADSSSASSKNE